MVGVEAISAKGKEIKTDERQTIRNRYVYGTKRKKRDITLGEKSEDPKEREI